MLSPLGSRCSLGVRGADRGIGGAAGDVDIGISVPFTAADLRNRLRTRWIVGCRVGVEGADVCFRIKSVRMAEPSW